jgi:hypothetical protein
MNAVSLGATPGLRLERRRRPRPKRSLIFTTVATMVSGTLADLMITAAGASRAKGRKRK